MFLSSATTMSISIREGKEEGRERLSSAARGGARPPTASLTDTCEKRVFLFLEGVERGGRGVLTTYGKGTGTTTEEIPSICPPTIVLNEREEKGGRKLIRSSVLQKRARRAVLGLAARGKRRRTEF